MRAYIQQLKENRLFANITESDIVKICKCLDVQVKILAKGTYVFRAGDIVGSVYMLISGSVHIIDEDFLGNRSIIESIYANTLFGEAYVLSNEQQHLVSVIAAEDSVVLEAQSDSFSNRCDRRCECHDELIRNTAYILSRKIVGLTQKQGFIMRRTIREKLYSYLSRCARQAHSNVFDIPYSRQQLADYLCVERSALSHELSKMRESGLIKYRKNHFEITTSTDIV